MIFKLVKVFTCLICLISASRSPVLGGFTMTTSGRLTQFDDGQSQTYSGSSGTGPTLVVQDQYYFGTQKGYLGIAAPNHLCAITQAQNSGTGYPSASAELQGQIVFNDNTALRSLITPGQSYIDLMVVFNVGVRVSVPNDPGIFRQATAYTHFSSSVYSQINSSASGSFNATNGPYDYTFSGSGVFSNFGSTGGQVFVGEPIRLSTTETGGLIVNYDVEVDSSALSLAPQIFSAIDVGLPTLGDSSLVVTLPDGSTLPITAGASLITTPDGKPVTSQGVTFTVIPAVSTPEPASIVLLGLGMAGIVIMTQRARRA